MTDDLYFNDPFSNNDDVTVTTDKQDYLPGETAEITADGFASGETVTFDLQEIAPGEDGIFGTADDNVDETYPQWSVTDGGIGDADGAANGSISTEWIVPQSAFNSTLKLSATGDSGNTATHWFTDSGGSYTLKWTASDPAPSRAPFLPTYDKVTPTGYLGAGFTYPSGRTALSSTNPLYNSVAYASPFASSNLDAVTSLAPKDMALGQIVPFQMEIKVTGSTAPENGVIIFTPYWLTKTTSGGDFGFDPNYKVIAAFVDTSDPGTIDPLANATVDSFTSTVVNTGTSNEQIQGTFQVSGLDNGDNVIVEIWVVLKDTIPPGSTGNVQTGIVSAQTATNETINAGNQTVPLLRVQEFFSQNADLSVIKSDNTTTITSGDDPAQVTAGSTLTYTIVAKNNSTDTIANGVTVVDTLDPNVTFVPGSVQVIDSQGAISTPANVTYNSTTRQLTADLDYLLQGEQVTIKFNVTVNANAPTASATSDILNTVNITAITSDPTTTNNTNTEPTDVISAATAPTISILKNGPTSINEGGSVATYTFTITNNSSNTADPDPVTITSLNDDKFGNLLAEAQADNGGNSIVVAPNGSFTFDITRSLTLDASGGTVGTYQTSHTNTITVIGRDDEGTTATATDPHTVTGADVAPTINILKNGPASLNEGGGVATYTFTITNASAVTDPVTITSLNDDKFGNLLAEAQADNGGNSIVIAPNGSFTFDITRSLTLDGGELHTNTVTVIGRDDEGTTDSGTDDHTVTGQDVAPTINVLKNGPATLSNSGVATYTFTLTNASAITDPVTITSINDDKFGNLLAEAQTDNGGNSIVIAPNATFTFDITRSLTLAEGQTHTNTVTVIGRDDEGTTDSGTDDHTVTGGDTAPTINILKNGPAAIAEGGGVATYTFTITNASGANDPVTITSLNDDKFGDLLAEAVADNGGNSIAIAPNGSFTFDITRSLTLDGGELHTNTVTVIGTDDEGTTDSGTDDHTVTGNDVAPTINIVKNGSASVNEGGSVATYTFTITNASAGTDPVTITSLNDDKFGDLLAEAVADNGGNSIVINPNGSFTFDITRSLTLDAGDTHTNTVTVIGTDDEGTTDSGTDDHTVTGNDVAPTINIVKNGSASVNEGGSVATYTFTITNASAGTDPVTITSLNDDKFGDLLGEAQADLGGTIVIQPNQSVTFDITRSLSLNAGATHTNTVTVIGKDDEGTTDSGTDDHTVTGNDVAPTINIVKNGSATVKEGGDTATYTFTITNASDGTDPVTITSLNDDKFGDLLGEAQADNGGNTIVINPNGSFTFDITRSLTLNAGATHTNTVTVIGKDDEGTTDSGTDDHTVTGQDVAPTINIVKNGPASINEGGGVATYTFTITNASVGTDPVTITSLNDDKFGNLLGEAQADNGGNTIVINPNGSFTFDITRSLTLDATGGTAGTYQTSHTNTVTVIGKDDEGTTDSGTDDHTVTGANVAPTISVLKNGPATINEGGSVATYTFTITNNSAITDPVTITSISDDKFGSLLAEAVADNGGNTIVINPSGSFTFDITRSLTLDAIGGTAGTYQTSHINTVTVIGRDDEGTTTTATDNHTVSGQDVAPTIDILKNGPATLNEGGGTATYTFTIFNKSVSTDPVTITSISDDKFGSLLAEAQADNGGNTIVINPNGSFTFDITRSLTLDAGDTHINTVTVIGRDDEGTTDSGTDNHTITGANVAPTIDVVKNVSPTSFRDTVGGNVTYTVTITNNSSQTDPVTITSLPDRLVFDTNGSNVYGDTVNGLADQVVNTNVLSQAQADWTAQGNTGSIVLQPNQTFTFDYTVNFPANTYLFWEDPINTITAIGVDDEGSQVSDSDDAAVDVTTGDKRSLVLSQLTGQRPNSTTVRGYFRVDDASSGVTSDVVLTDIAMGYERRQGNRWVDVVTGQPAAQNPSGRPQPYEPTQFWVEIGTPNGVRDAGETILQDLSPTAGLQTTVRFNDFVYLGYQSTFSGGVPSPLRATSIVGLPEDDTRFGVFTNTTTFTF